MPLLTSGDAFRACSCERRSSASDQVMRSSDVAYLKTAFVAWLQPSVATNFSRKTDQNSQWAAQPSTLPAGRLAHGADVVLLRARRHRVGVYKAHTVYPCPSQARQEAGSSRLFVLIMHIPGACNPTRWRFQIAA